MQTTNIINAETFHETVNCGDFINYTRIPQKVPSGQCQLRMHEGISYYNERSEEIISIIGKTKRERNAGLDSSLL